MASDCYLLNAARLSARHKLCVANFPYIIVMTLTLQFSQCLDVTFVFPSAIALALIITRRKITAEAKQ